MSKTKRTLLAFLLAPATTPLIIGLLYLIEGWRNATSYFAFACLISYPVSWTGGLTVFLALKKLKKESILEYATSGFLLATTTVLLLSIQDLEYHIFPISGICGILGAIVSTSFILIRGQPISLNDGE